MFASKAKQPPIKSLIAQGTRIQGDLLFAEGLRIDGEVVGNVRAVDGASLLIVSEVASVQGSIEADHVIINGRVKGPVMARKLLELQPKADIKGDVSYCAIEMHQGATVEGQLRPMASDGAEEKPTLKLAANDR
ncbi:MULTISPECIES: bactofilin family protein [Hydrogenophaga]|jgi:cytoskeletal protein CcmA (bactofilin family)|uniref:Integral membrane protein CcmA n=1 Tax=Hydrogenophaga intermedia TaxID=65786 RepID=A0A1L1P9Y7_HYDIT|nr:MULTISPECIES: polymer-forming cytoskeletal protein [Hydrogenophaga]AOS77537.1 cell shape determination protein CcmA [Hydrogenophaga sp. PBC]TMU75693.1 polymer-forming cytoskeletal protein [Hydrogenophaga intermedia]CDN86190.1 Integral membrane protein CcmA [Hydrogenophaga intermedia]